MLKASQPLGGWAELKKPTRQTGRSRKQRAAAWPVLLDKGGSGDKQAKLLTLHCCLFKQHHTRPYFFSENPS